jgi:hypothetical protein
MHRFSAQVMQRGVVLMLRRAGAPYDRAVSTALVAGLFGLGGGLGGVLLSALTAKWSHSRTISAEDDRRWLVDRRTVYAAYLTLAEQMLQVALIPRLSRQNTGARYWD